MEFIEADSELAYEQEPYEPEIETQGVPEPQASAERPTQPDLTLLAPEASPETPSENIVFLNRKAVNAFLKAAYEKGGELAAKQALLRVPSGWMQELIKEAFEKNPWTAIQSTYLDIDGIIIPSPYWIFDTAGKLEELKEWRKTAEEEYLTDFSNVQKFIANPKFSSFGGWQRIRNWWPEIVERAFRKNQEVSISVLICNLYTHTARTKEKDPSSMEDLKAIHGNVVKQYIEESYANARKVIFSPGFQAFGGWGIIPQKWIDEFCKEAFRKNPFEHVQNSALDQDGVTRKPPTAYYQKQGRYPELSKLKRATISESMDTLDKVFEFTTHGSFNTFGGWKIVPERWHKILVIRAVMQAKLATPGPGKLVCKNGKQSQSLEPLYLFYKRTSRLDEYMAYYNMGLQQRKAAKEETKKEKTSEAPTKRAGTSPRPEPTTYASNETIIELIKLAQEGDLEARDKIVGENIRFIAYIALEVSFREMPLVEDLINEGVLVAYNCIEVYEIERGSKFISYLGAALRRSLKVKVAEMRSKRSHAEIRSSMNNYSQFKRETGENPGDLSIEEIIAKSGWGRGRVTRMKNTFKPNAVSTEATPRKNSTDEGLTIGETIADKDLPDAEQSALAGDSREIMEFLLGTLDTQSQIIFKQYYGVPNGRRITLYQLRAVSKLENLFEQTRNAAEKLRLAIIEFCKNPSVTCDGITITKLLAITTASVDSQETIDGENALGILLKGELSGDLQMICIKALSSLTKEEAIMLTEIFNIPRQERVTLQELGNVFGVSRENIRQIMKNKMPRLRQKAKMEFGFDFKIDETISTDDDAPPSNWEYIL